MVRSRPVNLRRLPLLALLALAGCCSAPWNAYPETTPPDRSCSTGEVHGHDVYIWECLRGEHVVVAQYSAEMTCSSAQREAVPCGGTTPLEASLKLTPAQCSGPRAGRAWR
jgi:hypothetical protein